jgi:hypothetical protein
MALKLKKLNDWSAGGSPARLQSNRKSFDNFQD